MKFLPFSTAFFCFALFFFCAVAEAATLGVSPATGVYTAGDTFVARVTVNTNGKPINAADGTLSFNPNELAVIGITKGSVFNLWTAEPAFSNSNGRITFSGGNPTGYSGTSGTVISVTFRVQNAGNPKVSFQSGSVLAADGLGTNVLTTMNGGSYTVAAAGVAPEPEVIEYVAPVNTPAAPIINSSSHPDAEAFYTTQTAELEWELPADVIAVRTLLNDVSSAVPNKVYDTPISEITIEELDEGIQYFHLQFKNNDGWGKVAHYRLAVDVSAPDSFDPKLAPDSDLTSPNQTILLHATDTVSAVSRYSVQINGAESYDVINDVENGSLQLTDLAPGAYSVVIEAFDEAGNSTNASVSFSILAFDKPAFTEYPKEMNEQVIPVLSGITRPGSLVYVYVEPLGEVVQEYEIIAGEDGVFTFVPNGRFTTGVYEIWAVAVDQYGAQSEPSDIVRIAVQKPGYLQVGSFMVSVLSVIVPLIVLSGALVFCFWFIFMRLKKLRGGVRKETKEALMMVDKEFSRLKKVITEEAAALAKSRKTNKLTKAEDELIEATKNALTTAKKRIQSEVEDVEDIVE